MASPTRDWMLILITGIGLLIYPFALVTIWLRNEHRDPLLSLIAIWAMLFGMFVTAWTGQSIRWVWGLVVLVAAITLTLALVWSFQLWRRGKLSQQGFRVFVALFVPSSVLFNSLLRLL